MGEEIDHTAFRQEDFELFRKRLAAETVALEACFADQVPEPGGFIAGFELEACLIDRKTLRPAAINRTFLERLDSPLASAELAAFNVEFNTRALPLEGAVFSKFHANLKLDMDNAQRAAAALETNLISCGILPTLQEADLSLANMSVMKRYRALNEQVLAARRGKPLKLEIKGREHLVTGHHNVMLEAAATSFQLHLQTPWRKSRDACNAAILISAPLVATAANSPFLFGRDLWDETRIPLFEQSVETGGYDSVAGGPLHRVSFGSGYVRHSILECFRENLEHYPPLLPVLFDNPEPFAHLRLHNGTLWRWNRPLVGFNADGSPHIRLEHRTLPGGPSITDTIANAALFYGLVRYYLDQECIGLEFARARDNFYQAARFGLGATLDWLDGKRHNARILLLKRLIPEARAGLQALDIAAGDIRMYLDVIEERVASGINGTTWQRRHRNRTRAGFKELTADYLTAQQQDEPVHLWRP